MSPELPTPSMGQPVLLAISQIRRDGATQPRVGIDFDLAYEYGEAMKRGEKFPPVIVFFDGTTYWLADGFHRVEGAYSEQIQEIEADVRQGTMQDAQWYSLGANKAHGARRTRQDVQRAIETALHNFTERSDRWIAKQVGCDQETVTTRREKLESGAEIRHLEELIGEDGKKYPRQRAGGSKRKPILSEKPAPSPAPPKGPTLAPARSPAPMPVLPEPEPQPPIALPEKEPWADLPTLDQIRSILSTVKQGQYVSISIEITDRQDEVQKRYEGTLYRAWKDPEPRPIGWISDYTDDAGAAA